jgi:hypothetical protein
MLGFPALAQGADTKVTTHNPSYSRISEFSDGIAALGKQNCTQNSCSSPEQLRLVKYVLEAVETVALISCWIFRPADHKAARVESAHHLWALCY